MELVEGALSWGLIQFWSNLLCGLSKTLPLSGVQIPNRKMRGLASVLFQLRCSVSQTLAWTWPHSPGLEPG